MKKPKNLFNVISKMPPNMAQRRPEPTRVKPAMKKGENMKNRPKKRGC